MICTSWLMILSRFINYICFVYTLVLLWPVQSHDTWHNVIFYYVVWMSWFMLLRMCFYNLYGFVLKNMFFVAPLGVKRSDISHCFEFVSWCQCCWLWVVHWFFELGFCSCLLPLYNFYCGEYYGKPAVRICSLCLSHNVSIMVFQLASLRFS